MGSTAQASYGDGLEAKLITAITTSTTTGVTLKVKKVNGVSPTWKTGVHRFTITQRTATNNKREKIEVAAGTTQSGQTVTLGTLTRALSLYDGTNFTGSVGTAQSFAAGADVYITWDSQDAAMTAKLDLNNAFTGNNTHAGTETFNATVTLDGTTTNFIPPHLTTAQRTALSIPAGKSAIVYDTDLAVHYQYVGGSWSTFATGSVSAAANTTAGKVDIATTAEIAALTANDATSGAPNALTVGVVSLTTATSGKIPALNSAGKLDVAIGGTGVASPTSGNLLLGAGTSAMTLLAPSTSGLVPVSNGSTFVMGAVAYPTKVVYNSGTSSGACTTNNNQVSFDTHSYTIPANDLISGVSYHFYCAGTNTHTSGNWTFAATLGGSNLNGTSGSLGTGTSSDWWVEGWIHGTAAAGASVAIRSSKGSGWLGAAPLTNGGHYATVNLATNGTLALAFALNNTGVQSSIMTVCTITRHTTN